MAFNVTWADGKPVGHNCLQRVGSSPCHGPSFRLRTGCFCNIGGCQEALQLSDQQIKDNYAAGRSCWTDEVDLVNGERTGAVRVSVGRGSKKEDVDAFLSFLEGHFVGKFNEEEAVGKGRRQVVMKELRAHAPSTDMRAPGEGSACSGGLKRLSSIYVYPIKSCGGLRVPCGKWPLTLCDGLLLDREWVVRDARSGRAVTQKTCPQMCLLKTELLRVRGSRLGGQAKGEHGDVTDRVVVVVSVPETYPLPPEGNEDLRRPLVLPIRPSVATLLLQMGCVPKEYIAPTPDPAPAQLAHFTGDSHSESDGACSKLLEVRICSRKRRAHTTSSDADAWISSFLQFPCQMLGRGQEEEKEKKDMRTDGGQDGGHDGVASFANEAPLLLVNAASMRSLLSSMRKHETTHAPRAETDNATLLSSSPSSLVPLADAETDMQSILNFRPNLVLEGASPHEEELWTSLECHGQSSPASCEPLVLDVDKPCARCSIVNINTQSGVMDKTVLSSLSFLGKSGGAAPSFGLFVKVRAGHGNVGKMMLLAEGSPMR